MIPTPMLLSPAHSLPVGDDWAYEIKWDGMRTLLVIDHEVKVRSRHGRDHTEAFPELTEAAALAPKGRLVLDGELVCLNPPTGRPSFEALMRRVMAGLPALAARKAPATFMAFDILEAAGKSTCSMPWSSRRDLLEGILGTSGGQSWRVNVAFKDGSGLLAKTAEMGLEGVVAKRCGSRYLPGRRSPHWRKVKHQTLEWFDLLGWVPPRGRDRGGLLVAEDGRQVGVAFPALDAEARQTFAGLAARVGVESGGVVTLPVGAAEAQVAYLERMPGGRLREPIAKTVRRTAGEETRAAIHSPRDVY